MKEISLERWYRPVTISDDAYERITRIIAENKVCQKCHQSYTDSNPQVALNLCKNCFMKEEGGRYSLSFVGVLSTSELETGYGFLDKEGYLYTTYSNREKDVSRSIVETLRYWHFTFPETYEVKGETVRLYDFYWNVYGDFKNASVVIIGYSEYRNGDSFSKQFLAFKDGGFQELNRRKGVVRMWFAEAKRRAEATRDASGDYHIHGYRTAYLNDSRLYSLIADIVNEEQSQTQSLM